MGPLCRPDLGRWSQAVSLSDSEGKGSEWVAAVLERRDLTWAPELEEARRFVGDLVVSLHSPAPEPTLHERLSHPWPQFNEAMAC